MKIQSSPLPDILSRTAVALRGPEPELTRWSWHDLPELVNTLTAERDAACAYAGRLRETIQAMMSAEGLTVYCTAWEVMLELGRAALALIPPAALAAQQAETARLRAALAELSAATIDSRCICHDEPEGDTCEYCLRRRDAHEVADGLCFYKHP